jgi:hypothetical protein
MGRSTSETGADKAVAVRKSQAKERTRLLAEIAAEQQTITGLREERAPIAAEVRKVEAEVGPIKYIAAMLYGDNPDGNLLESAVRWVIILIVAVFDPLALMLILAAQQSLRWGQEEKIESENQIEQVEQVEQNIEDSVVHKESDASEQERLIQEANDKIAEIEPPEPDFVAPEEPEPEKSVLEQHPYLNQPFIHFENSTPLVYQPEPEVTAKEDEPDEPICCYKCNSSLVNVAKLGWFCVDTKCNSDDTVDFVEEPVPEPIEEPAYYEPDDGPLTKEQFEQIEELAKETLPVEETMVKTELFLPPINEPVLDTRKKYVPPPPEALPPPAKEVVVVPETADYKKNITVDTGLTADNDTSGDTAVKAHFGITFPDTPEKGELYLRVDYLPSRLFKYNGSKWIEVDKSMTDSYVYDSEYIKFLIVEIEAGHVDPDELSQSERDQITEYLLNNEQSRNPS